MSEKRWTLLIVVGVLVAVGIVGVVTFGKKSAAPTTTTTTRAATSTVRATIAGDPLVAKVINVVAKPANTSAVVVHVWNTSKNAVGTDCGVWQFIPGTRTLVGGDTWAFTTPVSPDVNSSGPTEKVQGRFVPKNGYSASTTVLDGLSQGADRTVGSAIVQCRPASNGSYDPGHAPTTGPGT